MARISVDVFNELMATEVPFSAGIMAAEKIGDGTATMRLAYEPGMLRPGGTVAGPFVMALADACMYAAVLGAIGAVKMAVTTSLNINFLRRPPPGDLIAEGRVLKIGRRLAVIEVELHTDGKPDLVAHATGTYSLPPEAGEA